MSLNQTFNNINPKIDQIPVPDVNVGTVFVDGYNVSKLVVWFSELSRYDTSFKKTTVSLKDSDLTPYLQTLYIYAALAGIVAVGLTIFLVGFFCCNCMFRSAAPRGPKHKGQRASGRSSCILSILVIVLAVAGAATFVVGFIGEKRLHTGAGEVCIMVDTVNDKAVKIKNDTSVIRMNLDDIDLNRLTEPIKAAEDLSAKLPSPELHEQIKQMSEEYYKIYKQVNDTKATISGQILDAKILDTMISYTKQVQKQCPEVSNYMRIGALVVLIVLAVSALLFIIGLFNNCFRSIFTLIGYITFNILVVFGSVSFLVLIAGSDLCLTSKPVLQNHVNESMLNYYLYCNKSSPSANLMGQHFIHRRDISEDISLIDFPSFVNIPKVPPIPGGSGSIGDLFDSVQDYIKNATKYTEIFNETLHLLQGNIQELCPTYLLATGAKVDSINATCKEVVNQLGKIQEVLLGVGPTQNDAIFTKMQNIMARVVDLVKEVDCTSITILIDNTFTNVCTNVYEAFFFFLVNSLAATICFYTLLIVSIWMLFT